MDSEYIYIYFFNIHCCSNFLMSITHGKWALCWVSGGPNFSPRSGPKSGPTTASKKNLLSVSK